VLCGNYKFANKGTLWMIIRDLIIFFSPTFLCIYNCGGGGGGRIDEAWDNNEGSNGVGGGDSCEKLGDGVSSRAVGDSCLGGGGTKSGGFGES
jgi:hypothetical protein